MIHLFTVLRSIVGFAIGILDTFIFSSLVFLAGVTGHQKLATRFINIWADIVFSLFGVTIITSGEENLPEHGGGVIVFNHQSHFDIPALCVATDKQIRFGAKIELFKIPVFGMAMRAIGTLPIARENRSEVLKIYKAASKRFEENTLFVLAPEGTRQKLPEIGRFKKGPFIFAVNAKVPIFPAVISGAHEVLPARGVWINVGKLRREIHVHFLPPVDTTSFTSSDIAPLVEKTRTQMVDAYQNVRQLAP